MEVMNAIKTRRSIRRYTEQKISEEILHELLEAGFCAPSAMNYRPYHFVVVQEKEQLQRVSECSVYSKMIESAACCIVVVADTNKQKLKDLWINDCSASIQNILLAAHSLGLGAVWCGVVEDRGIDRKLKEVLLLPDAIQPAGMISIGYPAENREVTDRFEESKVHYEKW